MSNIEAAAIVDQIQNQPNATEGITPQGGPTKEGEALAQPNQNDRVSSKMEILIRRERDAVNRERIAKEQEAALEAKLAKLAEFDGVKDNPKKALELLGLSYDELTRSILADGDLPPDVKIKKVEDKFDAYRREQEASAESRAVEEKRQAEEREQKAIVSFKGDINTYLSDNKVRYELIEFESQQELVFDVIDENYNRTIDPETGSGKVMTIAEAADKVEEFLEKKYQKSGSLNKVKAFWGAIPKDTQKVIAKQEAKPSQPPKTLTNSMSASTTPRARVITDEERVAKAIAYARGLRPQT